MSDYPRPAPPLPPKPYGPDRAIAITFTVLVALGTVLWFAEILGRPRAEPTLSRWWGYYVAYLCALVIYGWVFLGLSRSRLWAFVTILPLVALSIFSNIATGNLVRAGLGFVLAVYVIARLFGFLGPRPLRRLDVHPG